jgi:hypothetical protein
VSIRITSGVDAVGYWLGFRRPRFDGLPVVYVAHPVGADTATGIAANVARAHRWLAWLLAAEPDVAFCMPWAPYVATLPEDAHNRARGLRDDLAMVGRCDAIVLVGGRLSSGMALERAEARRLGLAVHDWTRLGEEPPAIGVQLERAEWAEVLR